MSHTAAGVPLAIDVGPLARLEADAAAGDPELKVALAWHLRQRDTARALSLADAADAALSAGASRPRARLRLLRAEAAWLRAELPVAAELALQAQAQMQRAGDHAGMADAAVMQALIAVERGERDAAPPLLERAQALARAAGDLTRARAALAMNAFMLCDSDVDEAERRYGGPMAQMQAGPESVLQMWAWDFRAYIDYRRGAYVQAIAARHEAYRHALACGQNRRAILDCLNIGGHYLSLNDHAAGLPWIERGLQLARPTGWPNVNGAALQLLGRALTELGRMQPAREALDEATRVLLPLADSKTGLLAVLQANHLALRMGEYERAASALEQLVIRCEGLLSSDLAQKARFEWAVALAHLGRGAEAVQAAETALRMAQADRSVPAEIDALDVLAEVRGLLARRSAAAGAAGAPTPELRMLRRAVELSATVTDFVVPVSIWDRLAAGHASQGEHAQAYAMACKAASARERLQQQQTSDRAVSLAAQLRIERLQIEHERLHEQAALSAERAELLQATHATLERLGRIGQEITAQLDVDTVFDRIYGHLRSLVDAPHLSIWLVDDAETLLHMRFGIEAGTKLPPASVSVQSESSLLARCWREARELEHHSQAAAYPAPPTPHAPRTPRAPRMQTGLFGPLRVRGRAVGVLSIGSQRSQAYAERERLVFRALCAFGAVALGNAAAYAALHRARADLQDASEAERRARHEAERASRMKNEFLAGISGTLSKPLGALHEALMKVPRTAVVAHAAVDRPGLADALQQCLQVNALARELLDLARLESGAAQMVRERFPMADLAQDVLHKLAPIASARGQRLSSHVAADLPDVLADIAMIEYALSVLMQIALQRLPAHANVQVRLRDMGDVLRVGIVGTVAGLRAGERTHGLAGASTHDGGLRLAIARQMLLLHGSGLDEQPPDVAPIGFEFSLSMAPA